MTAPTIADTLKYANLQMAAEAFLLDGLGHPYTAPGDIAAALVRGNGHASRFTQTQADAFAAQWEVVDQRADTKTGFSGTLFRNKANPSELVISFRSTEFIDDAIRDSAATNTLEVHDTGFAWGQITDMEVWYKSLKDSGTIPAGSQLSATGYSLGGHLATAFNLLRREDGTLGSISNVVTFNGAGVGRVKQGTLTSALDVFRNLIADTSQIKAALNINLPALLAFYDTLHQNLKDSTWTATQGRNELRMLVAEYSGLADFATQSQPLEKALSDIIALQDEAARIKNFTAGGTGPDAGKTPVDVKAADILAETLDYRLAVDLAGKLTQGATVLGDVFQITGRRPGSPPLLNQYDVVGVETTTTPWSAVSYSQYHYGENVSTFIEDQPFTRGDFTEAFVKSLPGINLLHNNYDLNNFSDTHSLTLLVDSLNIQNTLSILDPSVAIGTLKRPEVRAKWRSARSRQREPMFMRLSEHMLPRAFIHEAYSAIQCDSASAYGKQDAQNNSLWEHVA